uniref:Mesothelin n=1 Tax=Anas platyrhynchos TaxID=8839 RepID=A0A8B9TS44_ANAPL
MYRLSQSVLQGYTCAVANEIGTERVQQLAKVMKKKNVQLGEDQVSSCVPKSDQLFDLTQQNSQSVCLSSPSDYAATGSCRQYFASVGKANLDLLQRDSSERKQLLLEALACLVCGQGTTLLKENAEILGHLVCDLGEEYIRSSGENLLEQLSQCASFLPDQEEAIKSVISSGNTTFGYAFVFLASVKYFPKTKPLAFIAITAVFPQTYPDGYPDSLLSKLGSFLDTATPEEIKRWRITSPNTLAFLLKSLPKDKQVGILICFLPRFASLFGNCWFRTSLVVSKMVGPSLKSKQVDLKQNLTKDILYAKAKRAFSDQHNLPSYYTHIEPYLGGAPGADLKALSKDNVNMSVDTLAKLRTDSLMSLTPAEVKGLLGVNIRDLVKWQNKSPIREWVRRQKQAELDKLAIGLTGGTQEGYIIIVTPQFQRT